MGLQTEDGTSSSFVMIELGVLGDHPPDPYQPVLVDGIHLRWAFTRELGFPWFGYYLFRRKHVPGDPQCFQKIFSALKPGAWAGTALDTPYGRFHSNRPLVLTDDFPPASVTEFDLDKRDFLQFDLERPYISRRITAKIGFRKSGEDDQSTSKTCIDFTQLKPRKGANPRTKDKVRFETRDHNGKTCKETSIVNWENALGKKVSGLNCEYFLYVDLPCSARSVELTLTHFSRPAEITALNDDGKRVDAKKMIGKRGVPETISLNGKGITKVVIAAPQNEVLLHKICFDCGSGGGSKAKILVTALLWGVPVAQTVVSGLPGEVVTASLEYDTISAIRFSSGPAALVDLCFVTVNENIGKGWEPVPDFPQPLSLPVAHSDYPCPGAPVTQTQAEGMAVSRILYGDPAYWGSRFNDLHEQLRLLVVDGPPPYGLPMYERSRDVSAASSGSASSTPSMPAQRPLDLILSSSINPAVAQMTGLYWVDQKVDAGVAYDYLIVGDYLGEATNYAQGDPYKILDFLRTQGFDDVAAYIVFNKRMEPSASLDPPGDVRAYALPGGTLTTASGALLDAQNNAGLTWDLGLTEDGQLLPGRPILYHLWRADLGQEHPSTVPADGQYNLITDSGPVLVGRPRPSTDDEPLRVSDWPPFPMHAMDRGLADGWYSYCVAGIDIFGRHSSKSQPGSWYQWEPMPDPAPWYYQTPPGNTAIEPFAIALLDKMPPPPPTGVEAHALDPDDPTVIRDGAYNTWWATLSTTEQGSVIGLRVRWLWTAAYMQQAPDTREFRIYNQPGRLNALLGRTVNVSSASGTQSDVETDIQNTEPADRYVGTWLRIDSDAFEVVGSDAGTPLRLRVRNIGVSDDIRPGTNAPCTVSIQPGHPLFTEYASATSWQERFYVVGYDEHVTVTTDDAGQPLRVYEVLLPAPGDSNRSGLQLTPSLADPVAYGQIGVSAVDNKTHTADDSKWDAGDWGGRFGNEGRVSPPATVFRVLRTIPDPPAPPPPDSDKVYATPADYHSYSFYTYRWAPVSLLRTHIFRAMDDALFKRDWLVTTSHASLDPANSTHEKIFPSAWSTSRRQAAAAQVNAITAQSDYAAFSTDAQELLKRLPGNNSAAGNDSFQQRDWVVRRSRGNLASGDTALFPAEWDDLKRQTVAAELNSISSFGAYAALSNDGMRALAGLPGNDAAFTQITIQPLNPDEPDPEDPAVKRWRDRVGPDNLSSYAPDTNLRAYVDTLDGRSSNRYFYRAAYVDGAHNFSSMSLSSTPVYLPNVVPPRTPVVTKVLGGDRQITLKWASNREADLVEYRVYRAESERAARDLRLMTLVHTELVPAGDPAARPSELVWTDNPVPGLTNFYYRFNAVDNAGNVSVPSKPLFGRAFDESIPAAPSPAAVWIDVGGGTMQAQASWTAQGESLLQRRAENSGFWTNLTVWLPAGAQTLTDSNSDPAKSYEYRLRVRNEATGATATGTSVHLAAHL